MSDQVTKIHKPRVDDETFRALQRRAEYIKKRTGQNISVGATIRWMATLELSIKEGLNN